MCHIFVTDNQAYIAYPRLFHTFLFPQKKLAASELQRLPWTSTPTSFDRYRRKIMTEFGSNKRLYLDILNYSTDFFLLHDWNCTRALARMDAFVSAAHNSGWSLKAFIDATSTSEEAKWKWRSRRAKEVRSGSKNMPHGCTILIGDMLRKCGVEVCYSFEADNDDTIAFHAQADGASILSHDKDMFRYLGATFTVFSDYEIRNGELKLTTHRLHEQEGRRESSKRAIGSPPAVLAETSHTQDGVYLRGAPSPLVKALRCNPHAVVAPLRRAMFAKLHIAGPIVEEWPEWCVETNDVKWVVHSDVVPATTPELDDMLASPVEAVKKYFPVEVMQSQSPPNRLISKKDWRNHVYCVRSVVYEICATSDPSGPSLLDMMLHFETTSCEEETTLTVHALSKPKSNDARLSYGSSAGPGTRGGQGGAGCSPRNDGSCRPTRGIPSDRTDSTATVADTGTWARGGAVPGSDKGGKSGLERRAGINGDAGAGDRSGRETHCDSGRGRGRGSDRDTGLGGLRPTAVAFRPYSGGGGRSGAPSGESGDAAESTAGKVQQQRGHQQGRYAGVLRSAGQPMTVTVPVAESIAADTTANV